MGMDLINGKFEEEEYDTGFDPEFAGYDDIDVEEDAFDAELSLGDDDDEEVDLGQDVPAWCSRCSAVGAHTVVTRKDGVIRQVLCNKCGDEHGYRPKGESQTRNASRTKQPPTINWGTFMAKLDQSTVRDYSIRAAYLEGNPVNHPLFGIGVVVNVKGPNKMEVLFEAGIKRLIFNRQ